MPFLRNAAIAVLLGILAHPAPVHAAQVAIVQGDLQAAAVGEAFPEPLAIRLTADDGSPLAGVDVIFFIDVCNQAQLSESSCPPPTGYPTFEVRRWHVHVPTDSQGIATSPPLRAGISSGNFQVAAGASDFSSGWARFQLIQVEGDDLPIDAGFSGMWIDTAHPGQGLLLEVLDDGRVLAFWIGYRPDRQGLTWFGGDAPIERNIATIEMRVAEVDPEPGNNATSPWGFLALRFPDCDRALVDYWSYDRAWGEGAKVLVRLTRVTGTTCVPAGTR